MLAAMGDWRTVGSAVVLFALADRIAGALPFSERRTAVPAPAAPGTLRMFHFTWRAVGWRLVAPLPVSAFALMAAWFYTARLWSVIALALYIGALGDIVASRRPTWPWVRSLPWSSAARAVDNAVAIGAPALGVAVLTTIVDPGSIAVSLGSIPPLAALASLLLHGARHRLTRVSGRTILVGIAFATVVAYHPLAVVAGLLTTPLLLRAAARRDRREVVTAWKELHHDAAGDSLAWSAR
jgi:hypothetical protein